MYKDTFNEGDANPTWRPMAPAANNPLQPRARDPRCQSLAFLNSRRMHCTAASMER
jgi:hypothetical protein